MHPEHPQQITPEVVPQIDATTEQLVQKATRAAVVLARQIAGNADAGMAPDVYDPKPRILRPRQVRRSGW